MGDIEKFIRDNEERFNPEPSDELWTKIENDIDASKKTQFTPARILSLAAIFIALLGISYVLLLDNDQEQARSGFSGVINNTDINNQDINLGNISDEYAEIENHYVVLVNSKMKELNQLDPNGEFKSEIKELEDEYKILKKELGTGGNDEAVIHAMIENYRLKLGLLESILGHLNDSKNETYEVEI